MTDRTRGRGPRRGLALAGGIVTVATGLVLGVVPAAGAHVGITPSTTAAGATAVLEVSVPHGCDGSATTEISVQMPTGVLGVVPRRHPSWDVETDVVELTQPLDDGHGNLQTERVASVTYRTDEPLPDGVEEVFAISLQLPEEGTQLWFPTIQRCEDGEAAWIEVAEDGRDEADLELPAPTLVVTAADGDGHGTDHDAGTVSDETSTDASGAPVADGAGGDGSTVPAYAGLGLGVLGAVLGGTALVRQRRSA